MQYAVQIIHQSAAGIECCSGIGPVQHYPKCMGSRRNGYAHRVGFALAKAVAHELVLLNRLDGTQGINASVAMNKVGSWLAEVVGGIH